MKKIKKLLALSLVFVTLFSLTGCGGDSKSGSSTNAKKENITLNVYNWGDFIDEEVLNMFEEETGIKVAYETYGNNEELLSKIESGTTNYDVLFPSEYMVEIMAKKGLLSELDFSKIPNYENIDPRFKGLSYDKEQKYAVPYMYCTVGICYNKEEVDAKKVKSWDILWDEEYKGNIIMLDSSRDSIAAALIKLGYSLNSTDDKQLEEAKNLLIAQKPLVNSYQTDYYKTALIGEEALMSLAWSGDAMLIMDENPKFAYSIPKEGTNISVDNMVVPAQSDNKEAAMEFINFMNREDIALKNAEYIMYSTPNTKAYEQLPEEIKTNDQMYPQGDINTIGEIFVDLGDYNQVYDKIWTQVKTAQ